MKRLASFSQRMLAKLLGIAWCICLVLGRRVLLVNIWGVLLIGKAPK